MKTTDQDKSAEFEAAVISCFNFLEADHGFLRRSARPQKYTQLVIYESRDIYVVLSYGPPGYEPDLSFGRRGVDDVPGGYSFDPADLIHLDCCIGWSWNKDKGNALPNWVAELARLFRSCGSKCLNGDSLVFTQMRDRRDRLVADWKRDERLKGLRAQIDLAWKAKDYHQVLSLYGSIDELTDIDRKRITFATAHK